MMTLSRRFRQAVYGAAIIMLAPVSVYDCFSVFAQAIARETSASFVDKPRIADEVQTSSSIRRIEQRGIKGQTRKSLEVVFTTNVPEAEIYIGSGEGMRPLGKTDAQGKLVTRLPRGRYSVLATRTGYRIERQLIEVRPGSQSFSFDLKSAAPPAIESSKGGSSADAAKEPVKPKEEPKPMEAAPPPLTAEKVIADAEALFQRTLEAKPDAAPTLDDWRRLEADIRTALDREPNQKRLRLYDLLAQGQVAYLRGNYPDALVAFNKVVFEDPQLAIAHLLRGNVYLATNQPEEAFKAYQQASRINPKMALAYRGMGDVMRKQGKEKEADQYYRKAAALGMSAAGEASAPVGATPTTPNPALNAARNLKRQKKWAQALREFQSIAEKEPSAELYLEIGDCYRGMKQVISAMNAYRRAMELDPKFALAHYKYGELMYEMREYAAASEAMERALALDLTGASIDRRKAREIANRAAQKLGR
ncbi:MAG: hypothetical protein C4334_06525 [Pyrinomonas sp.]|uniref:tetratricopeptide repeat protein n=1 Tax=Pyrinomonas sp. TaxID=2080306 RepID=UPI003323E8BE